MTCGELNNIQLLIRGYATVGSKASMLAETRRPGTEWYEKHETNVAEEKRVEQELKKAEVVAQEPKADEQAKERTRCTAGGGQCKCGICDCVCFFAIRYSSPR